MRFSLNVHFHTPTPYHYTLLVGHTVSVLNKSARKDRDQVLDGAGFWIRTSGAHGVFSDLVRKKRIFLLEDFVKN